MVVAAPLAIGGVHSGTRIVLGAAAFGALAVAAAGRHARRRGLWLGPIGAGLLLLLAWTFLQWVPLPAGLASWISPAAGEAQVAAAQALGVEPPSWHPIALDPPRTAEAWLSLFAAFAVYVVAAQAKGSRHAIRRFGGAIVLSAGLVLAVGAVQHLAGTRTIYGFYEASSDLSGQFLLTTFVNPNHAAALFLLAGTIAFGYWTTIKGEPAHWLVLAASMSLALGVAATGSRANFALLPVAYFFVGAFAWSKEEDRRERLRILRILAGGVCVAVSAFFVVATERWFREVSALLDAGAMLHERLSDDAAGTGLRVVGLHPWVGVGHGSFEVASTDLWAIWPSGVLSHPHNLLLQALADWGIPVALAAGGLLAWGFASAIRKAKENTVLLGAGVALGALVLQNLVDFSLSVPGVGLAAACATGLLAGAARPRSKREPETAPSRRLFVLPAPAVLVLGGVLGLTSIHASGHEPERLREEMRQAVDGGRPGGVDLREVLRQHPRDFALHRMGALVAGALGDSEVRDRLADRALALAPAEERTLLLRARLEIEDGRGRTALPFLLGAASQGQGPLREALRLLLRHQDERALFESFLARDERYVLELLDLLKVHGGTGSATAVLEWAMPRFPGSIALREELAERLLSTAGGIERLDAVATDALARAASEDDPATRTRLLRLGYFMQGFVLHRKGKTTEARVSYEEAARLDPEKAERPLRVLGRLLVETGDFARLRRLLPRLEEVLPEGRPERAEYHALESQLAESEGDLRNAIRLMQKVVLYQPAHTGFAERLARLYETSGNPEAARIARGRTARAGDGAPK